MDVAVQSRASLFFLIESWIILTIAILPHPNNIPVFCTDKQMTILPQ